MTTKFFLENFPLYIHTARVERITGKCVYPICVFASSCNQLLVSVGSTALTHYLRTRDHAHKEVC